MIVVVANQIINTSGAGCPLTIAGAIPLLTMDVWEHAYYLDYQSNRETYCKTFLDSLVDWEAAGNRLPSNV